MHVQSIALLSAYLDHMAIAPSDSKGLLPMANTLAHYMQAAISLLAR
jgi:hypothetical protein